MNDPALLQGLFPSGVMAAELWSEECRGELLPLYPDEACCVEGAVPKRKLEFATGRLCARRALAKLGFEAASLPKAKDGSPSWPHTIVGSITHTHGYTAAVVGMQRQLLGLGIDAEECESLGSELWPIVCTTHELARLRTLPASKRAETATVIFSAKEAFYKSLYPLTRQWLDFLDVNVEIDDGSFKVELLKDFGPQRPQTASVVGRFRVAHGLVVAAVALLPA